MCIETSHHLPILGGGGNRVGESSGPDVGPMGLPWRSIILLPEFSLWGIGKGRGIVSRKTLTKMHVMLPKRERWISGL